MSLDPKQIGRRIADARNAKGWTQLAFALEADVSPSTIARWESGRLPPVRELVRIAELLGVSAEELVEPEVDSRSDEIDRLERELRETQQALAALPDIQDALARIEALLRDTSNAAQSS